MKQFFAIFAFIALIFPQVAFAAADEAGGAKLKAALQDTLDYQKVTNEAFGSVEVVYDGAIDVKPQGEFYNVTLPRILVKSKQNEDNNVLDLGVITLNALPDTKPGNWKMTLSLPSMLTMTEDSGSKFQINIGGQTAVGLFNEKLGYFTKMDMTLRDLTARLDGNDVGLKLAALNMHLNLDEVTNGRLSGPGHIAFDNLGLNDEDSKIHAQNIRMDFSLSQFLPLTIQEYQEKIMRHRATFDSLQTAGDENAVPINNQAVMNMLYDLYDFKMDGVSFRISGKNIGVDTLPSADETEEDEKLPTEVEKFNISDIAFGMDIKGLEAPTGSLALDLGYKNLSLLPVDPEYDGVLPTDTQINIKADKIPVKGLSTLLQNTGNAIAQNPDLMQMAGMGVLFKLPMMLSQAGSEVAIQNSFIKGGLYKASLDGKVTADVTSVSSFTAKFKGMFEGLDELLAKAKANAANPDSVSQAEFADLAASLEQMQAAGKAESSLTGKKTYHYDFEMTPQGQFLMNGSEMKLFEEPAIGDPAAAAPAPAIEPVP